VPTSQLFAYALHLADNALILAQRNAEWTGHGPVLEQDIAITNISLDLLGQARHFYQYAADLYNGFSSHEKEAVLHLVPRSWKTFDRELQEDDLAFLREGHQYLNLLLVELPRGDWAQTVLRQALFSLFQQGVYAQLKNSKHPQLAAIAEKSGKETAYHVRWSSEWVIRLGDGTEESHRRLKNALEEVWPFTGELFRPAPYEDDFGPDIAFLKSEWLQKVAAVFTNAQFDVPQQTGFQYGGKEGRHTEHLGYLLAEMQYLQRAYPNAAW
jgi:ring-1,2-phenylacetyl-CoA epoxidase subunit PaaC